MSRTIFIGTEDVREYYTSRLISADPDPTCPIVHSHVSLLFPDNMTVARSANPVGSLSFGRKRIIAASTIVSDLIEWQP